MSLPCKSERSQLSHEEFEMVRATHHPAIYELAPDELRAVKLRLQNHRDKARVLARQKQREVKGKAEPRGRSFPGTAELPRKRKQVFAAALKRVNKELDREHFAGNQGRSGHPRRAWLDVAAWVPVAYAA
jgi:hypothetical protein